MLWRQRDRERGRKRHRGTDRHYNNTHAGQEKSISISLTQKSMYGCNFLFFSFNVHLLPPRLPSPPSSLYHPPFTSLNVTLRVENSSGNVFPNSTLNAAATSQRDAARLCTSRGCLSLLSFVCLFGVAFICSSVCQTDSRLRSERRNGNARSIFTSEATS